MPILAIRAVEPGNSPQNGGNVGNGLKTRSGPSFGTRLFGLAGCPWLIKNSHETSVQYARNHWNYGNSGWLSSPISLSAAHVVYCAQLVNNARRVRWVRPDWTAQNEFVCFG